MRFVQTPLRDAKVITLEPRRDDRGYFARSWCRREFREAGIDFDVVQANFSVSKAKGTIRGMHFQRAPFADAKVVRCVKGSVQEVIVDMRPRSPTYLQHFKIVLSEPGDTMVFVPTGFAQGIQTLSDDAVVEYLMGEYYRPELYDGVRHDDPALGIEWPLPVSAISPQDLAWSDWNSRQIQAPAIAPDAKPIAVGGAPVMSRRAFPVSGMTCAQVVAPFATLRDSRDPKSIVLR
jgi:dTDP-4-dehydrorhamnose 3,5-epimerase